MEALLIGYFPKKVTENPAHQKVSNVKEICSAGLCFFEEPGDWLEKWKHNEYFLYDTPEIAKSIIEDLADRDQYDLYAFKQYPIRIEEGNATEEEIKSINVEALSDAFRFLGYDAVSKDMSEEFGCSPLSCNYGADIIATNEYCLFSTFEEALSGAKIFSTGEWEAGPYYIIEVYRQVK